MCPSIKLYPTIPYDHRWPAKEEVFVGRNRIVDQMADGLRTGYSYGLVGEAGMGKTSILFALQKKIVSGWVKGTMPVPIPVYIRLDEHHLAHVSGILEAILSGFIDVQTKQWGLVIPTSECDMLIKEVCQGRLEEALHTLSDWFYRQQSRPCRQIILLDDLHRGLEHEALSAAVSVLRPLVSPKDTTANVSLVLSGELPLEQEFRKDVSALRALLSDTRVLTPLLPKEVAFLVELAKDYGWSVEPGCEEVAFTLTQGHPFKLHYYLFTALDRYGGISRSVLQQISQDRYVRSYLDTVLKQTSAPSKQYSKEQKRVSKTTKILFLAANPKNTSSLRLDEEMRDIDVALRQAEFRDRFDVKQQWAVRVADLQGYFLRHQPDIVHFSGHGSASSQIILEDKNGNSHPVSPHALSQVFSILKGNIRCVVLNACYSEQQAQAIARHIDCVVGMSKAIGDAAAISFAAAFYQALGYGQSVKTAFDLGRAQIDLENLDEQDTPKLLAINTDPASVTFVTDNS